MKHINNDYDALARRWWSDNEGTTATIRYMVNPVRFGYFQKVLAARHPAGYSNKTALDVGCGGGLLAEELAKIGLRVTGVDPSEQSLDVAGKHAAAGGLDIRYLASHGERLPFDDASFDMVFCCDVLEHVDDVSKVTAEIARVLKRGGIFFFDTINRTVMSWIAVIYLFQKCPFTAFVMEEGHAWRKFIKPAELRSLLVKNAITCGDLKGIGPEKKGPAIIAGLYRASRGAITYREMAETMRFREISDLNCSYMGYGIKSSA